MLRGKGSTITMTEGDYGVSLPMTINGINFERNDAINLIIKSEKNGTEFITKTFTGIENNTFDFMLTKEESNKLTPKKYVYVLDWYRENSLLCNLINDGVLEVEDKC